MSIDKGGTVSQAIKAWPVDDRPREKLWKYGEQHLSNSELLAILLRTGSKGISAIDLSRNVLDKFGSFRNMSHTDVRDWKGLKGLGMAKIAQLKAAIEIGRRFRGEESKETRPQIKTAADIVDILMPRMRDLKIEVFKAVFLNNQNRIIAIEDITEGTVNQAHPIIREIYQKALQHFAVSIICVHNHPSGGITPSVQDKTFTKDLYNAGKLLSIKVLDHVIIGDNEYFSFSSQGLMKN
jgi:DNA repair protein RadC